MSGMVEVMVAPVDCAYCRHSSAEHRRAPGGKLRICRRLIQYGTPYDIKICGCRAFRGPDYIR